MRWRRQGCAVLVLAALHVASAARARAEGGLLVVAPHPDDETLIAAGAMVATRERGA